MEDRIYNYVLEHVESVMGNGITDEDQLRRAGKQLIGRNFLGVFPADITPKLTKTKNIAIMNLDPSWMPGSHWITIVKDKGDILVYDSLGRKATKILPILFKGGENNVINTELDKEQDTKRDKNGRIIREDNCGQRSLVAAFIYDQFGRDLFLRL